MSEVQLVDLIEGARNCVVNVAMVQPGDKVLVLTDTSIPHVISELLATVCKEQGAVPIVLTIPAEIAHSAELGGEIPDHVVSAVSGADVVLAPTSFPLQHTPALRGFAAGVGDDPTTTTWINIPPPHALSFTSVGARKVTVELGSLITETLIARMQKGKRYHLTTSTGSDLVTEIPSECLGGTVSSRFSVRAANGVRGKFCVFPYGVMNPTGYRHEKAHGTLVVDAIDHFQGLLSKPVAYTIRDGWVEEISGGFEAEWIQTEMNKHKKELSKGLEELSVGTNPGIPLYKNNFAAVSVYWHAFAHRCAGAVHIAIGEDPYFHLHGLIMRPTLTCLDTGDVIVQDGYLTIFDDPKVSSAIEEAGVVPSRW